MSSSIEAAHAAAARRASERPREVQHRFARWAARRAGTLCNSNPTTASWGALYRRAYAAAHAVADALEGLARAREECDRGRLADHAEVGAARGGADLPPRPRPEDALSAGETPAGGAR